MLPEYPADLKLLLLRTLLLLVMNQVRFHLLRRIVNGMVQIVVRSAGYQRFVLDDVAIDFSDLLVVVFYVQDYVNIGDSIEVLG